MIRCPHCHVYDCPRLHRHYVALSEEHLQGQVNNALHIGKPKQSIERHIGVLLNNVFFLSNI